MHISQVLLATSMATDEMTGQWPITLRTIHQKLIYLYLKERDLIYYLDV